MEGRPDCPRVMAITIRKGPVRVLLWARQVHAGSLPDEPDKNTRIGLLVRQTDSWYLSYVVS